MRETDYAEFKEKLDEIDNKDYFRKEKIDENLQKEFEESLFNFIQVKGKKPRAVLGIDIYQYSQYELEKQALIPMVFDLLKEISMEWCTKDENAFFTEDSFKEIDFIHTGDGGFFIFEDPFQAIIFNINFNTALHLFNSGHFYPKLFGVIKKITCRFTQTYDVLYKYNLNWFGPGIINNARILSKDKLDRFLIDENTYTWFLDNINGIETLAIIDLITVLKSLNKEPGDYSSAIFRIAPFDERIENGVIRTVKKDQIPANHFNNNYLQNCHCLKIGEIKAKNDSLSVYNVNIQRIAGIADDTDKTYRSQFVVSIGNLNTSGLE